MTFAEKTILSSIDHNFNWIARDQSGELWIFNKKPIKAITPSGEIIWGTEDAWGDIWENFSMFNHMFDFITPDEPYEIERQEDK